MSSIRRAFAIATLLIVGLSFVPVTVSSSGGLGVNELCASGECKRKAGAFCMQDGQPMYHWKTVAG